MLKQMFMICLLMLAVFVSGCAQAPPAGDEITGAVAEEQAYDAIEQEMEKAIENITMEEIEQALIE